MPFDFTNRSIKHSMQAFQIKATMETANPVSSFVTNNPWIAAGPHMRCVGTGLLALWRKNPDSALRIGASVMAGSPTFSTHFWPAVSHIGEMADCKTRCGSEFARVLESYSHKKVDDTRLMSIEWSRLYSHRTALSCLVELACTPPTANAPLDEWGKTTR